jgi:choline dehydrogenase
MTRTFDETDLAAAEFAGRVRRNQQQLASELRPQYDFVVCGSGSSGSVVARRLAENPDVTVLLLEAGGTDDVPEVMRPEQWPLNLGSERDWNFVTQPHPHLNGRSIPFDMGKVLGGGSSINVMAWARGHKNDWDLFAAEAGDKAHVTDEGWGLADAEAGGCQQTNARALSEVLESAVRRQPESPRSLRDKNSRSG